MRATTLLLFLTTALLPSAVRAECAIGKHLAKVTVPIDANVVDPITMETVHLTGSLLMKTSIQYSSNDRAKNVTSYHWGKDTTGIGTVSGTTYEVTGGVVRTSGTWAVYCARRYSYSGFVPLNRSEPTNPPTPPVKIRFQVTLEYDPASGSLAGLPQVDFPNPPMAGTCTALTEVCL